MTKTNMPEIYITQILHIIHKRLKL